MPISRPLSIGVASTGRFHMFDLTRQLSALGHDVHLFAGYPAIKVDPDLRRLASTRSRWVLAEHLWSRLPGRQPAWLRSRMFTDFGNWVERSIRGLDLDLLDALEGSGLEAGRAVRDRGKVWICNRGSAHILTQKRVLEQEHRRWGGSLPAHYFPPKYLDRCLAEYEGADAIVVGSTFSKRTFVEQGSRESKVHVCPYGVDLSMFKPVPKEDKRFRVLFVGTQSIRKGIGYLLDALRPLVQTRGVELWLIGHTAPEAKRILDRYADVFQQKGPQPRRNLSWFYSQGSVLVLPSIEEGLALVQAQAMACGVPVISTRNSGAEDLYTDGVEGLLVPARDPRAIRERILWLMDNPERRDEMAEAALSKVKTLGGWESYGMRCLEVYRNVLRDKLSSQSGAVPLFEKPGGMGANSPIHRAAASS